MCTSKREGGTIRSTSTKDSEHWGILPGLRKLPYRHYNYLYRYSGFTYSSSTSRSSYSSHYWTTRQRDPRGDKLASAQNSTRVRGVSVKTMPASNRSNHHHGSQDSHSALSPVDEESMQAAISGVEPFARAVPPPDMNASLAAEKEW